MHRAEFRIRHVFYVAAAACLAGLARAPDSHAQTAPNSSTGHTTEQDQLEEVVVTAERRAEDIQKVAASVSVRTGQELQEQGRYELSDILQDVAGVVGGAANGLAGGASSGTDQIAAGIVIRGIQSSGGVGGGITSTPPTAGYYVDDVYGGVGGDFDINRIEVLRGPQGTLYGRSATSGVVAVHTNDPALDSFNGFGTVELGDYELRHYTGAINIPLGSTLAVRVAANSYDRDGYYSTDGGAIYNQEGRVKLLWKPTDSLSVLLGAAADNNIANTGGIAGQIILTSPYSTYQYLNQPLGHGSNNFRQYWGNVTWDFGPATLTYLPSVRTWNSTLTAYERGAGFPPFNSVLNTPEDNYITHELRLSSKPGSALTWQAGALYYDNNLENSATYLAYPSLLENIDTAVSRDTRDLGVFAEATYPLASDWRITGGLRYDRTQVDTNQLYTTGPGFLGPGNYLTLALAGGTGDRTFSDWTYKARVEHDLAPDNMLYAMISTGFAPGDVTAANNAVGQPVAEYIKEETLTAYEFGSKNRFLDSKLQINGDVFYENYGGWQSAATAIVNGPVLSFPILAAGVESYGAEFETLYQLTAHDRVGLTFTWTHATYVDRNTPVPGTTNTFETYQAQDQVVSAASAGAGGTANTPASAPVPELVNVTFDHVQPLTNDSKLTLHADARWLSPHYEGPVSAEELATNPVYFNAYARTQGEYIADVSASWAIRKFSLTGYVRNVGDNRYKTNVSVLFDGSFAAIPYNPRTIGIILNVAW